MSDIAPKPISAPSGVMPALPTATPAAPTTATAAEIPAAVANLSVGTFITGTVVERSPRGLVTLRTDKGTIKLQTPVPLKTGSTVTLQIQSVGAQVQLSILSIDGQPVANAPVKAAPGQIRPDVPGKPTATESAPARPQGQTTVTTSQPLIGDDGHEATVVRQTSADRAAPERGVAPRATMAQPAAPAASFVARPLAQIGSAGLEALSSPAASAPPAATSSLNPSAPPTVTPGVTGNFVRAATLTAPATNAGTAAPIANQAAAVQASITPTSVVQVAAPMAEQVTLPTSPAAPVMPGSVMAGRTPSAPMPVAPTMPAPVPSASAPMAALAVITPGSQFTASPIVPPAATHETAEPSQPPVKAMSAPDAAPPPSQPVVMSTPAAPIVSAATPAQPADRIILRLLGMDVPQSAQSTSVATAPAARLVAPSGALAPAAEPRVAAGVTVPSGALTTVGTIVEGPDLPHLLPQSPDTAANAPATARTLIATPFGVLAAPGPAPGPVGTRLLLEVVLRGDPSPLPPQPLSSAPTMAMTSPPTAADKTWPALREIVTAMQTMAPDIADHLANVTLPRVGPNLAASMMAFVAAARQSNPRAWLGEQTVDTLLRTGHGQLLDRLSDDFQMATRIAADTSPHGWQTMLLPLYDGDRLQQIRFYWQRQKRKSSQRKEGTRFVVEAELTKLGVLQLDGIFDKPQFDLVVRTSTSLPAPIRSDIIEIFGDALLATNLKGAVSFQTNSGLQLGVLAGGEEPPPDGGVGLVV